MSFEIELDEGWQKTISTVLAFTNAAEGKVNVAYVEPCNSVFDESRNAQVKTVELPVSYEDFKQLAITSRQTGQIPSFSIEPSGRR